MHEHGATHGPVFGQHAARGPFGGRLWFGVAILALGILWTLDNLGFVDSDRILEWWPVVLIAFGLSKLLGRDKARPLAALLWIGVGTWLLAHNLGVLPWGIGELWPVLLILLGLSIVRRALVGPRAVSGGPGSLPTGPSGITGPGGTAPADAVVPPGTDTFSCTAIWAGVDRKITSQAFRGGDYTAIMGGGDVNLRGARPVPGGAVIEVFVVMGGIDIRVPEDWHVVNQVFALMGGIEDSRGAAPSEGGNVLYLKGTVLMGGVEIKN